MKIITIARKPLSESNVASNVLKHGCGALNVDASRIAGPKPDTVRGVGGQHGRFSHLKAQGVIKDDGKGRWPSNLLLLGGCPVDEMGRQSGVTHSSGGAEKAGRFPGLYGTFSGGNPGESVGGLGDTGTAARYFKQFKVDK